MQDPPKKGKKAQTLPDTVQRTGAMKQKIQDMTPRQYVAWERDSAGPDRKKMQAERDKADSVYARRKFVTDSLVKKMVQRMGGK